MSTVIASTLRFAPLAAIAGLASAQHVDVGFDDVTLSPDVDLVIVREAAYGAGGIDLTPYGITGTHDFVQSIYVRARHGTAGVRHEVQGRLTFSPGVTVLGIIKDPAPLGGSTDDGAMTGSDLDFGIGGDPDAYSAPFRGSENVSEAEHICIRPNGTVDFNLLMRRDDVDDFRVIIDYGSSFAAGATLGVELNVQPAIPGVVDREAGIRVGSTGGGGVQGSGDFGEVAGLSDIPLTTMDVPVANGGRPFDPADGVLVGRVGGPASSEHIEMFDPVRGVYHTHARLGASGELSRGPHGYAYGRGLNVPGCVILDLVTGSRALVEVAGLEGAASVIGGNESGDTIVIAGHVSGVNSDLKVNLVDVPSATATDVVTIPVGTLVQPVAAVWNGTNAYIVDQDGTFATVDFVTGTFTTVQIPSGLGTYWGMEIDAAGTTLYLVHQASGTGITSIDTVDVGTGGITTSVITVPSFVFPRGITRDANGHLWLPQRTFGQPVAGDMLEIDPSNWTVAAQHDCAVKWDPNTVLADVNPAPIGTSICTRANPGPFAPPAVANTTGRPGATMAFGSITVADNDFHLRAADLPTQSFGFFFNGTAAGFLPVGSSPGHICIDPAGGFGRHSNQVMSSGGFGSFSIQVDLNALPRAGAPGGVQPVLPGETWYFQCWHRQAPSTWNYTDAISVTFG